MDHLRQLAEVRGYFLRREAQALGYDDRHLQRLRRANVVVRIRHGAYCYADLWRSKAPEQRHLAIAYATQDLTPGPTALSHVTALAHYGCPLWGVSLDKVHLTRLDGGSSRCEAGTTHHDGVLSDDEVGRVDGRLVTSPTRATLDGLSLMSTESAMVSGDWMLGQQLTNDADLWAMKMSMNHWPNTLRLEVSLRLLDGRSESVGESRERHLFWTMGLPKPELQFHVYDAGRLVAVTDFAWPKQHTYGEFDGRVKYGRVLQPGQEPGDVVFQEKRREDAIRRLTAGTLVRHTWADLTPTSGPSRQLEQLLRPRPLSA